MSRGFNKVIVCGKVVGTPKSGNGKTRFYLNVAEFRRGQDGGEGDWLKNVILIEALGGAAERAAGLGDGDRIMVEGQTAKINLKPIPGRDGRDFTPTMLVIQAHRLLAPSSDNVNIAILVGRVGKAPDIKYFESGSAITSFGVATDHYNAEKVVDGKKGANDTVWTEVKVVGKRAPAAAEFIGQGQVVILEGKITTDEWADPEGKVQRRTYLKTWGFEFGGSKGGGRGGDASASDYAMPDDDGYGDGPPDDFYNEGKAAPAKASGAKPASRKPPDLDDEIPF